MKAGAAVTGASEIMAPSHISDKTQCFMTAAPYLAGDFVPGRFYGASGPSVNGTAASGRTVSNGAIVTTLSERSGTALRITHTSCVSMVVTVVRFFSPTFRTPPMAGSS